MILEKCPSTDELLALSLGKLSETQSDEILGHLPSCEACQAELATANPLEDTLLGHLRSADVDEYKHEAECRLAMAKALGTLALANSPSIDDSEFSQLLTRVLGDYEIVRPIGRGGMGNVYLARHTKLNRQVALKVLTSHRLMQPRMRQRFETEMHAVGQLSHPNIVTAYDAREVDEMAVLVTEFIDGLDVGQILRRTGKLSVGNAGEIAKQTALALQYVYEQGLVHRDIKPSNVMIGKSGNVKLLDLGLARLQLGDGERVEMTATGQAMGTVDYIAPEQVNDSRHVNIRADIYALGCTLFKMLCGQPPFEDHRYPTAFAKMTAHVSDAPPSLENLAPEVPAALAQLVHRMISKDAADRPQTPAEVVELLAPFSVGADLKQLLQQAMDAGESTDPPHRKASHAPPVLQPETMPFFRRRVPLLVAIGAGLFGTLVGLALGIIITIKHPDAPASQVEAPDGSHTKVSPEGNVEIALPAGKPRDKVGTAENAAQDGRTDKDRLQGVWRVVATPNTTPTPGQVLVAFSDLTYTIMINGEGAQTVTFGITSNNRFSTLVFKGPDATSMQAIIQFEGNDKLTMQTEAGKMQLERIAQLPLTEEDLKRIAEDPNTVLLAESVRIIAEYQKTGNFPIPGRAAAAKDAAMQSRSQNNLKQIAIALHGYYDRHLTLPAAHQEARVSGGKERVVARSWRVAILPFIGEQKLSDQFKLDEDWNSPHNLTLLAQLPEMFRAPQAKQGSTETPYLAIVGRRTAISDTATQFKDVRDGTANTIALLETRKTVPWTKPEDLSFEDEEALPELLPVYEGGFYAAFADGSIKFLKSDTDEKLLRTYFLRDDDQSITIP